MKEEGGRRKEEGRREMVREIDEPEKRKEDRLKGYGLPSN